MANANSNSNKKVHRSVASLKLPGVVSLLITYVQGILKALTNNPTFPSPNPPLATIGSAVNDLQVAETAVVTTRAKGTVATRNEKRATLVAMLELLRAYVQSVADATPENAPSIIESAGLALRKTLVRAPRVFAAKAATVSGSVKLIAPTADRRAAYLWQYSTDAGKTWLDVSPTLQAKTTVTGLPSGTTVQFRFRSVSKGGASDWSAPLSLLVH
ncbi:MAG TPA: fibronectin type III domain-containing protein [Polyangiaceae bacterium]